jgi:hypothetical protein
LLCFQDHLTCALTLVVTIQTSVALAQNCSSCEYEFNSQRI